MVKRFGDRATFAVEVGPADGTGLRTVDLWLAGKRLTVDDNAAYVPSVRHAMRTTAARVRRRDLAPRPFPDRSPEETFGVLLANQTGFRERYWFLNLTEIVDNTTRYAWLDGDRLVVVFAFWRPTHPEPSEIDLPFVAKLGPDDLAAALEAAADYLNDGD
ncbi:hypothetical protein AB0M46_32060 [Dactylosporangium sp. NPDC051485]|uniref:hypothetical protein n=1 Tax=Dactylosporangium sp. NPDC051485 TaxID=3154846 RepID=UPI003441364A